MKRQWIPMGPELAVALSLIAISASAESPASKIARTILDAGCSIVLDSESDLWREAGAGDYQGASWSAWKKFTGVSTPWRVTGDFNGDGIADVARVVVRKSDGAWLYGVELGGDAKRPCDRFQIATSTQNPGKPIPGLLVLRKGAARVKCHHAAERYAVFCTPPAGSQLARRSFDALIVTDEVPLTTTAFLWGQFEKRNRLDGTPLMVFDAEPIDVDMSAGPK